MENVQDEISKAVLGVMGLALLGLLAKCRTYLLIKVSPVFRLFGRIPARENVTLHAGINEHLATLMGGTDSDAAFVETLHNSGKDAQGAHFGKFTVTHEVTKGGVASNQESARDMLLTMYPQIDAARVSESRFSLGCVLTMPDSNLRQYLKSRNIACILCYRVHGYKWQLGGEFPYGFVCITFSQSQCDETGECVLEGKYGEKLKRYAEEIELKIRKIK